MKETAEFIRIVEKISTAAKKIPNIAATEAVNFSKARFREQAWLDNKEEPWQKRKPGRRSKQTQKGSILVRAGRLRRSIRKIAVNAEYAIIGTDVPYAQVHNDGFEGNIKQQVRAHYRNRYGIKKTGTGVYGIKNRKEKTRNTKVSTNKFKVRSHSRTIHQKLPRRRFLAPSAAMNELIQQAITNEITNAIK